MIKQLILLAVISSSDSSFDASVNDSSANIGLTHESSTDTETDGSQSLDASANDSPADIGIADELSPDTETDDSQSSVVINYCIDVGNPKEDFIDNRLIKYVGVEAFDAWLNDTPFESQTVANFREEFSITDDIMREVLSDSMLEFYGIDSESME